MPGVIRTRVGYAGGTTPAPTYRNLGDHSEAVQIDFDPSLVSYRKLLDIFWKGHDATRSSSSRQYRQAIFYHSEPQRKIAMETKNRLASETTGRIVAHARCNRNIPMQLVQFFIPNDSQPVIF